MNQARGVAVSRFSWAHLSNILFGKLECLLRMCDKKDWNFASITSCCPSSVVVTDQWKCLKHALIHLVIISQSFSLAFLLRALQIPKSQGKKHRSSTRYDLIAFTIIDNDYPSLKFFQYLLTFCDMPSVVHVTYSHFPNFFTNLRANFLHPFGNCSVSISYVGLYNHGCLCQKVHQRCFMTMEFHSGTTTCLICLTKKKPCSY